MGRKTGRGPEVQDCRWTRKDRTPHETNRGDERILLLEDKQIDTICLNLYRELTLRVRPLDTICLPILDTICLYQHSQTEHHLRKHHSELTNCTNNDAIFVVRQKYSIELVHSGRRTRNSSSVLWKRCSYYCSSPFLMKKT